MQALHICCYGTRWIVCAITSRRFPHRAVRAPHLLGLFSSLTTMIGRKADGPENTVRLCGSPSTKRSRPYSGSEKCREKGRFRYGICGSGFGSGVRTERAFAARCPEVPINGTLGDAITMTGICPPAIFASTQKASGPRLRPRDQPSLHGRRCLGTH